MSCANGALRLDTDSGSVLLSSEISHGFKWIVGGHQVGAHWHPKGNECPRYLGGPSPKHANDSPLRLWFAADEHKNEMVVLLTLSVKVRPKSKARPRHFFLLAPAEALGISSAVEDFDPMPLETVPEALFERPADAASASTTRFLHASFTLGQGRTSRVVMPTRPYDRKLQGTPLALVDGLRSLSEARSFHLYFNFSSYAKISLRHMYAQTTVRKVPFITPFFDLTAMYRGEWDGGFDLWEAQGWHDDCKERLSSKRKAPHSPAGLPRAPPAYDAREITPAPEYTDSVTRGQGREKRSPSSPRLGAPPHDFPQPEPRPVHNTHHGHQVSPCPGSVSGEIVNHDRSCSPRAHEGVVNCLPASPSCIPETPRSLHPAIFSALTSPNNLPALGSMTSLHTLYPAVGASSLVSLYDREMGAWLLIAWDSIPNIHFTLIHELITIGAAVSNRDEAAYRAARMKCARKFVDCLADRMLQNTPSDTHAHGRKMTSSVLESEPESLISWLFFIRSAGDTGLTNMLAQLEVRRRAALSALCCDEQNGRDSFQQRMGSFNAMRAAVVLEVLCQEGHNILTQMYDETGGGMTTTDQVILA